MLQIILSSTNSAKKSAVINFFKNQKLEFELLCLDVESGVNKTPNSDEEGIIGCQNRIKNAQIEFEKLKKLGEFEFEIYKTKTEIKNEKLAQSVVFIGMEGIINVNKFGTFLGGWVCLEIDGIEYFGSSARCQLPEKIAQNATNFRELSQTVKKIYSEITNVDKLVDQIGTNGLLTGELYTRIQEFEDALRCSWGIFGESL